MHRKMTGKMKIVLACLTLIFLMTLGGYYEFNKVPMSFPSERKPGYGYVNKGWADNAEVVQAVTPAVCVLSAMAIICIITAHFSRPRRPSGSQRGEVFGMPVMNPRNQKRETLSQRTKQLKWAPPTRRH